MKKHKHLFKRFLSLSTALAMSVGLLPLDNINFIQANAAASTWKFDFGNNGTQTGFTGVNASTGYSSSRGYGFRNTGSVADVSASGSNELNDAVQFKSTDKSNTFDVDLPNGLYDITVTLGNTNRTSIRAEDQMQVINMTGNNATASFKLPVTDGQLNIMATEGKANYPFTISSMVINKISDSTELPPTVWICGDSTVCNYYPLNSSTQAGWGQVLGQYIDTTKWEIKNLAASGQYAKGFVNSGCFDTILKYGKQGDIYVISIGINDTNYSNETEYYETVTDMTKKAAAKGIKVVLVKQQGRAGDVSRSPKLTGRWFGGTLDKIGSEQNVQVVDLFNLAQDYFISIGQEETNKLYMDGDTLHVNREGAKVLAKLISENVDFSLENNSSNARQVEALDRGLTAFKSGNGIFLSWRLLGTESYDTKFAVYKNGVYAATVDDSTNWYDAGAGTDNTYTVRSIVNGVEMTESASVTPWSQNYLDVSINKPGSIYSANDATVADVDGDGQYEIILKWDPSDSQDNSKSGKTSNVYIDCYELDGTQKWRIDLGKNIRAGAHYTQFIAYDFDGDGKAEIAMKTADGTVDGNGKVIGDSSKDYRNSSGYILDGPEYLTMFSGETGAALDTIDYIPARGSVSDWGDKYGNRVDRFLAGVAYLNGKTPSLIMCRGYYTRSVLVAYDFKNGKLSRKWTFDTNSSTNKGYAGQGNHNLSTADVDGDGFDEIVYGSMVVDQDGTGLYSTGNGHGDAMHVSDFDPDHEGLEVFQVHEDKSSSIESVQMRDAKTGKTLWCDKTQSDVGRGLIANIGPDYYPYVATTSAGNYDRSGNKLDLNLGKFGMNFSIWWDADLYREGLDRTYINKWNYNNKTVDRLLTASNVHSNNSTKATPSLSADIFGDWREEVMWPTADDTALRIYVNGDVTAHKLYTFMHDTQYREAIAWQNVGYNQPPHPSFYVGEDMKTPTQPNVYTVGSYKEKQLNVKPKTGANITEGKYMIQNVLSGLYLDVKDGKAANGTNVQLWGAESAGDFNTWNLKSVGDGYYQLYSCVGDGSYMLDLDCGKTDNGANIQIYKNTDSDAQKFKFVSAGNSQYFIATKATTDQSNLDAYEHGKTNGTNICQWEYTGNSNQMWKLVKVEDSNDETEDAIYCSPNGGGNGKTKDSPTDVATAVSSVQAGGKIYLLGGTYSFDKTIVINESNSGTASQYKTIEAYNGADVVWDFSKMSTADANRGVVLDGSYWHFKGFTIQKAGDNGMLLSGDNNKIENMVFQNNQDTGLQISRYQSSYSNISQWPHYNLILNCTSRNNCDDKTMENADGFAAKLTCGEGNVFNGCMAYNNSDDGYDLYAKSETGPIGVVTLKNCLAFRNGYTEDGRGYGDCDGNGFKLGGGGVGTAHVVENCLAFENLNCGFTDNNNPNLAKISNCTAVNNGIGNNGKPNFSVYRCTNCDFDNLMTYYNNSSIKKASDKFVGTYANGVYYNTAGYYKVTSDTKVSSGEKIGTKFDGLSDSDFVSISTGSMGTDFHKLWRNSDGSVNTNGYFQIKTNTSYSAMGCHFDADSGNDDPTDETVGSEVVIFNDYPQFDDGTTGTKDYSFNVPATGKYVFKLQFQGNTGAYFKVALDGDSNKLWSDGNWVGSISSSDMWNDNWGTKEATVELSAGTHTIKVEGNSYAKFGVCTYAQITTHTHSYTSTVTKAATCTTDGVKTFTCSCGKTYTETIKATGHKYVTTTVAPTANAQGYDLHKCSVCGDEYKDNYTDKTSKDLKNCSVEVASSATFTGTNIKQKATVKDGSKTLVEGTDYTVAYSNNVKVGTASMTITGKGDYTGTVTKTFNIVSKSLKYCNVSLAAAQYTYNGQEIKPKVTVTIANNGPVYSGNYTVSYKNNAKAGTATVTITGKNNLTGSVTKTFKIVPKSLKYCDIELSGTTFSYTGNAVKPTVKVKILGKTVYSGNYTVSYKNNVNKGTASVTLTAKSGGSLNGSVTKNFTIK